MTSREDGEDGYFYATITAGEDLGKLDTGMDYVFVIDISGSMGNDGKFALSKESVSAFVEALGEGDRSGLSPLSHAKRPSHRHDRAFPGERDL